LTKRAEATAVRRRVPRAAGRHWGDREGGPGGTCGGDSAVQRVWPNPNGQPFGQVTHRTRQW